MEVEKAARELLQSLEAKQGEMGQVIVGFDIEWRPSFRRGLFGSSFEYLLILQLYLIFASW